MVQDEASNDETFIRAVEQIAGRPLDAREAALAASLRSEKSAALVAREIDGSVIADPKKIRPEHSDTAKE